MLYSIAEQTADVDPGLISGHDQTMAADYTSDNTYWTGRKRGSSLEVVRVLLDDTGGYSIVESYGVYEKHGAAVAAAAQLAYFQGRRDAQIEMRTKVHAALESVDLGPVVIEPPDDDFLDV